MMFQIGKTVRTSVVGDTCAVFERRTQRQSATLRYPTQLQCPVETANILETSCKATAFSSCIARRLSVVARVSSLSTLQSTRPIDRLRYQAKMVFDFMDKDGDGRLSQEELVAFVEYSDERFGKGNYNLDALYTPLLMGGNGVAFEDFVDLVRAQVAAVKASRYLDACLKGAEIGKLLYKCAIPVRDLTAALAIFKLLDFNNDGFLRVDEYQLAQGIEKKIYDDILSESDDNMDGFLTFENFLDSYAKERPVFLSMAVMAAHTAAYYLIFNSPLDMLFKGVLAAIILVRPAIITNPIIKIYHIINAIVNRGKASVEVGENQGGGAVAA